MDEIIEEKTVPEVPDKQPIMTLFITKEGKLEVVGLINDKIMALGALELAKIELQKHWNSKESKIHKPDHRMMDFLRNKK